MIHIYHIQQKIQGEKFHGCHGLLAMSKTFPANVYNCTNETYVVIHISARLTDSLQ